MRSFSCPACRQLLFFENTSCLHCGTELGYNPDTRQLVALAPGRTACVQRSEISCNWLLGRSDIGPLCASCALTRTRPSDGDRADVEAFAKGEAAKRRLVFQLRELDVPIVSRAEDPDRGLAFDLLSSRNERVVTGHAEGVVTLDLAESDDARREQRRQQMGEPYRTLLGHFRHEVGHYYWVLLVEQAGLLDPFRSLFGDERADYQASLDRHYDTGPPADWADHHVSAYATMHPWEDWAETFAHLLHIRDTLQTAAAFGLLVAGPLDELTGRRDPRLASIPLADDGSDEPFETAVADWLPLTYALNAVNRSMGRDDLYPFVLARPVIDKLSFVHARIEATAGRAVAVHLPATLTPAADEQSAGSRPGA